MTDKKDSDQAHNMQAMLSEFAEQYLAYYRKHANLLAEASVVPQTAIDPAHMFNPTTMLNQMATAPQFQELAKMMADQMQAFSSANSHKINPDQRASNEERPGHSPNKPTTANPTAASTTYPPLSSEQHAQLLLGFECRMAALEQQLREVSGSLRELQTKSKSTKSKSTKSRPSEA